MKPKFTLNQEDVKLLQHTSWYVPNRTPRADPNWGKKRIYENCLKFPLGNGDLLVMKGATQKNWLHHIPKTNNKCYMRINLTFRTLYTHDRLNPIQDRENPINL